MNVNPSMGRVMLDRASAGRVGGPALAPGARPGGAAEQPTRLSLGRSEAGSAVYSDPRTANPIPKIWSTPPADGDRISALMARNRDQMSYRLADQWRGLGGALLRHLGQTGTGYTQTLVDDPVTGPCADLEALPPEERAQRADEILSKQQAALAGLTHYAATAGLKIQTRSGLSVELRLAVNPGSGSGPGMKVELTTSGPLSDAERAAIEQLGDGLDRALEGLGRDDAIGLDLSGLMDYDRDVLASLDLTANNQQKGQALETFSLHLGDDRKSIALKGRAGELTLKVGAQRASAPHGPEALQPLLDRIDQAAERGHANAALVKQMKSAFEQFQARGSDDAAPAGPADFEASFGGDTLRLNRHGSAHEAGHIAYELRQESETKSDGKGGRSTTQQLSEALSADFRTAPPDRMLDVSTGTYSATRIRDRHKLSTWIETAADGTTRTLRKTDVDQLKTVTALENHRITDRQVMPTQRSYLERLA